MAVIDLEEARTHLERYAEECQSAPVIVTVEGKPVFELIPIRSEDPDFLERLAVANPAFRRLLEERRGEAESGKVSTLEEVRQSLEGPTR
jgi:antitoxin (DNA-binding transcriptional repressor) of toxin-antitoxin stability system